MKSRYWIQGCTLCLVGLFFSGANVAQSPPEVASSADLGGKERYLAHVSTDKPVYRIGERVYVRCVVLHAADRTPLSEETSAFFEILGPKGNAVASGTSEVKESVVGLAWDVPAGQAGGEHKVKISFPQMGIPPGERTFDVRAYRAPRIRTQITFFRDGYGPGDEVSATVEATRSEGGVPENAQVRIQARVDGQEIHSATGAIDREGRCTARFSLPEEIQRGEGTLAFVIQDGGVVETASKTIPILLQTVDVSVFPEGGELVAGLPCRVYLEARTPSQKPADISGVVVDEQGKQVGDFATEHEGRGLFVFVPQREKQYSLRITKPSGIRKEVPLPEAKKEGLVLSSTRKIYPTGRPVTLKLMSTKPGPVTVTLRKREVEVASLEGLKLNAQGGKSGDVFRGICSFTPPRTADGVLVATVWEEKGNPLAERLIFREPASSVNVSVAVDRERYVPGGEARLTVTTRDEKGKPVRAVVGLTVTDDSVLELIEKREQAPQLPVMVFLENEVMELADAHVYLDPDYEKAPLAVDLLLGTQGWRRFAWVKVTEFLREHGDDARRVLAMRVVTRLEHEKHSKGGPFLRLRRGAVMDKWAVDEAMPAAAPPEEVLGQAPEQPEGLDAGEIHKDMVNALEDAQRDRKKEAFLMEEDMEVAAKARMAPYMVVREYAHQARENRKPNDRIDFTETLYWCAGVATDSKTGQAEVAFDLNDSVTSFRILADGFTRKGAVGCGTELLESVKPFYVEPKLPLEVTQGDRVLVPVSAVNGTLDALSDVELRMKGLQGIKIPDIAPFDLTGDQRERRLVELLVGEVCGELELVLDAEAGAYRDRVTRPLSVVPRGFPVEIAEGGMLDPGKTLSFDVNVPESRIPASLQTNLVVYPAPLANLVEALEALIREPYGCFEQTTSTTYPLVMAQQYFTTHTGVDPELIRRSQEVLDKGYKRLTGFECQKKGYEWFGEDPGHEALTAYGLMEFVDMAEVYEVDQEMLSRTRSWLLKTKDGKGGFKRERRALHTWTADEDCSNAYITWSLLQAGEPVSSLQAEVEEVLRAAKSSRNSYVVALGANVALQADRASEAAELMKRLSEKQTSEGVVEGATTSIVASQGLALQVETTALALLSWLQDPAYTQAVEKGMHWLSEVCKSGRYGSTQSTVLALKAILAYDEARSMPKAPGQIELSVDGLQCGGPWRFDETSQGPIHLTDISELLEPGKHTVKISMKDGSSMPCSVTVTYADEKPDSSEECKVDLEVKLTQSQVEEGKVTEAHVVVRNNQEDEIIPMPLAIIGLPGGLEVRHDQLKELVKAKHIAAYEVLGRELVLYWRSLKASQTVEIPVSLVAALPGVYTGPASRAYQYYADEFKTWVDPLQVTVAPAPGAGHE